MGIGIFCRLDDFLPGGIRLSVTDIVIDCTHKQIDILLYNSNLVAQIGKAHILHIHPVNLDGTARHVIKTRDQGTKRALSGS